MKRTDFTILLAFLAVIGTGIGIMWWSSSPSKTPTPTATPVLASTVAVTPVIDAFRPTPAPTPVGQHCTIRGQLPDPVCTPGVTNPNVTQANINQTICVRGWTATIRPPVAYTNGLKVQQMKEYGFTDAISAHEEDHLIPLELGGAPSDPHNLWPEPMPSPNPKDQVEGQLNRLVCAGKMSLVEAQERIARDWTTALPVATPALGDGGLSEYL